MTGKGHLVVGGLTGLGVAGVGVYLKSKTGINLEMATSSAVDTVLIVGGALFGALLPDLDTGRSKINKYSNMAIMFAIVLAIIGEFIHTPIITDLIQTLTGNSFGFRHFGYSTYSTILVVFIIICALGRMSPHRGFTHKWLGFTLFAICGFLLLPFMVFVGYVAGIISHYVADKLYKGGDGYVFSEFRLPCQKANGEIDIEAGIHNLFMSFKIGTPLQNVGTHKRHNNQHHNQHHNQHNNQHNDPYNNPHNMNR